jgi:hypothetical protein
MGPTGNKAIDKEDIRGKKDKKKGLIAPGYCFFLTA